MAHTKDSATRPLPQPIVDVSEIDEALMWTCLTAPRNEHWHRWVDALLDQRNRIARQGPTRERRILYPTEYRDGQ